MTRLNLLLRFASLITLTLLFLYWIIVLRKQDRVNSLIYGLFLLFVGHGTLQLRLKQLLNGLKKPLKSLNFMQFSHISARANKAKARLEKMQSSMLRSGITP